MIAEIWGFGPNHFEEYVPRSNLSFLYGDKTCGAHRKASSLAWESAALSVIVYIQNV